MASHGGLSILCEARLGVSRDDVDGAGRVALIEKPTANVHVSGFLPRTGYEATLLHTDSAQFRGVAHVEHFLLLAWRIMLW